eukprot:273993_1
MDQHLTQISRVSSESRASSFDREDDKPDLVIDIFDFDKWIEENHLEEIKDCLLDYHMNTLDNLDLYSKDALKMMDDERIKNKPHLLPILMASVIQLQNLKVPTTKSPPSRKQRDSKSRRSSRSRRASQTPFAMTIVEDLQLADAWNNDTMERRLSLMTERSTGKRVNFAADRTKSLGGAGAAPPQGVHAALSGLNIRECKRSKFRMNSIDAYPQTIMHSLRTGNTVKRNTISHTAWIINICLYVVLILYIYAAFIAQEDIAPSLLFLIMLIVIWVVYSLEWISQMVSNSWKPPDAVGDGAMYDIERISKEVGALIGVKPSIKWNVKCYHPNTETDQSGRSGGRVETLEKSKEYGYTTVKDVSPEFPQSILSESAFTTLTIYKTFQFDNPLTKNDYYHRAELFRGDHDNEDEFQYFGHWMELPKWMGDAKRTANVVVQRDKEQSVGFVSKGYLALFSCLMCSACYRAYARKRVETQNVEYIVLKEISL